MAPSHGNRGQSRVMAAGGSREEAAQREIQAALTELVESGAETGLQAAVIKDGRAVVDAVAGVADPATGAAVRPDTLFYAASTAKGVATSLAHVLVDRGRLEYDMRIADVWPEFAARGKGGVTLRHVLMHKAGVPGLPAGTTPGDLCDWDLMCAQLADQEPWWEPGARFGYHVWTFGFLLGETIRRATGQTISAALREVITGPLGIEDEVLFGVPRRWLHRVARQAAPAGTAAAAVAAEPGPARDRAEPGSARDRAEPRGVRPDVSYVNRAGFLSAEIPSCGTMTARGVARMYSALLGQAEGGPLVSSARLAEMAAVAFAGLDEVMGFPTAWAFGYCPDRPGIGAARRGSAFGMIGGNGLAAYADVDAGISVAVMRNRFAFGDFTAAARIDQIVASSMR